MLRCGELSITERADLALLIPLIRIAMLVNLMNWFDFKYQRKLVIPNRMHYFMVQILLTLPRENPVRLYRLNGEEIKVFVVLALEVAMDFLHHQFQSRHRQRLLLRQLQEAR